MTIQLTSDKATKLKHACIEMLKHQRPSIRSVASLIGKLVASFPGVMFGSLYYRHLERDKVLALKQAKGNFDTCMSLSLQAKSELQWCIKNVESTYNVISHAQPQYQITTDASSLGWGAEFAGVSSGGNWTHLNQNTTSTTSRCWLLF